MNSQPFEEKGGLWPTMTDNSWSGSEYYNNINKNQLYDLIFINEQERVKTKKTTKENGKIR